jgi:hypothetical protein
MLDKNVMLRNVYVRRVINQWAGNRKSRVLSNDQDVPEVKIPVQGKIG